MQRSQLEHLIRAAAEITNEYEFVIIGSQSILGTVASPPPECAVSMEADIYPLQAPDLADLIDGAIGELSSKACAAREKDADFNRALLRHGIVALDLALARAAELEEPAEAARAAAWIRGLASKI